MYEPIRVRRSASAREMAAQFNISPRTVQRMVAEERSVYLARIAKRRKRVEELRRKGMPMSEIALEMDMNLQAVKSMIIRIRRAGGLSDMPLGKRYAIPTVQRDAQGRFKKTA